MSAQWKRPAVAKLIGLARRGNPWETIGIAFYPAANPRRAKTAAVEIFRRHASAADKETRAKAIRERNWNKVPGISRRAEGRRQRTRQDGRMLLEQRDPFAGKGVCFS